MAASCEQSWRWIPDGRIDHIVYERDDDTIITLCRQVLKTCIPSSHAKISRMKLACKKCVKVACDTLIVADVTIRHEERRTKR